MKTKLRYYWDTLQESYWFIPTMMAGGAVVLSLIMIAIDESTQAAFIKSHFWIYTSEPDGARSLLSTVAGSMITVAGVTFSITMVALSLASSQFGPRLLNNFMRDRGNQLVLGTYIATFLYCLLVLRTIRNVDSGAFVPHLSVAGGVVLAMVSLGVLIYFIDHVSDSIQVNNIIATVSNDLQLAINRLYPEHIGLGYESVQATKKMPADIEDESKYCPVTTQTSGYIRALDHEGLLNLAIKKNLIIHLHCQPGDFISVGSQIVSILPASQVNDEVINQVNKTLILGADRTAVQDIRYLFNQLVEIALRALSPGVNDPFTAITCIDWLCTRLSELSERAMPSPYRFDEEGQLRIIAHPISYEVVVAAVFTQIQHYGCANVVIAVHLLAKIGLIIQHTSSAENRAVLLKQANQIRQTALIALKLPEEREQLEAKYQAITTAFTMPKIKKMTNGE